MPVKDKVRILIAAIVYLGVAACSIWAYLPSRGLAVADIARDPQGRIYAAGGSGAGVYVCQLDPFGNAMELYRCPGRARESEIFCRCDGEKVYIAQMWFADGRQHFGVWEKAPGHNGLESIWERTIEDDVTLTDLQIRDGTVMLVGVDQTTESILLYQYRDGDDRMERFRTDFIPTTVCWGQDGLYVLAHDGRVCRIGMDGLKEQGDLEDIVFLAADEKGTYHQERGSGDIICTFYDGLGGYTYHGLGDVWNIQYSDKARNSAVLAYEDGKDRLFLVGTDGARGPDMDPTAVPPGEKLRCTIVPLLMATLIYIAACTAAELFRRLVWKEKKLLCQTMAVLIGSSGAWLVVTVIGMQSYERRAQIEERLFFADTCMTVQMRKLDGCPQINRLGFEGYLGSEQQQYIEGIFAHHTMRNSEQSFYAREELICASHDLVFLFSEEVPYGRKADTLYDERSLAQIRGCIEDGGTRKFTDQVNGISYAIAVTKVRSSDGQMCLIVRVPLYGMGDAHKDLPFFYVAAFAGWVLVMAAIHMFLRWKWANVGVLVTQMDKVSRGEYRIDSRRAPDNEFGTMWTALDRMCRNLQMQEYRDQKVLEQICAYAPENFEKLFSKEKLQDIEAGESVQLMATLGMIAVIDKGALADRARGGQYADQMAKLMFAQEGADQAVFLQDGSSLEVIKAVFPETGQSAQTALAYSISLLEALSGQEGDGAPPFILLHTSHVTCGLAGGERHVYPYAASPESDPFAGYIDRFRRSGARIVVTEDTWQQAAGKYHGRSIGHIAPGDGRGSVRLYEILDACPQAQRAAKLKGKQAFEAALALYQEDALYAARSAFADLLRECPEDGIARWYLFACDSALRAAGTKMAGHALFGQEKGDARDEDVRSWAEG